MSLVGELVRFDALLTAKYPEILANMNPGLSDDGIAEFRDALQPMGLTAEVETLYRWHDGGASGLFGGWTMLPSTFVVSQRSFYLNDLQEPPAWLRMFDDQCIAFVTLEVRGSSSLPGVWYGHTHDGSLDRLFVSIESMVATCSDALEAGLLQSLARGPYPSLRFSQESSLDGRDFTPLRVAREAVTFVYPNPPAGTYLSRNPEPGWPPAWLASLGLDPNPPAMRGATHTIAQLIELSSLSDASGTIQATVKRFGITAKTWIATVDDGTGELVLSGDTGGLFGPRMRQRAEFDVQIDALEIRNNPAQFDRDPRATHPLMTTTRFPGVPGHASAVRALPN
jgi:hypothetical protein